MVTLQSLPHVRKAWIEQREGKRQRRLRGSSDEQRTRDETVGSANIISFVQALFKDHTQSPDSPQRGSAS